MSSQYQPVTTVNMSSKEPLMEKMDFEEKFSSDSDDEGGPTTRRWNVLTIVFAIISIVLGTSSIFLYTRQPTICNQHASYDTEWEPATADIKFEKVTFTNALRYNETSNDFYREYDESMPQYVGIPEPSIDEAWEDLLAGQYLIVTDDEASRMDDAQKVADHYFTEVEVMHSLHCLNAVRKAMYPEYYAEHDEHKLSEPLRSYHLEHCIDQLRQTIQCAGDLTPVPIKSFGEGRMVALIGNPQVHTCRNWDNFRNWYTKRGHKFGYITGTGT